MVKTRQKKQKPRTIGIIFLVIGFVSLGIALFCFIQFSSLSDLATTSGGEFWEDIGEIFVFSAVGSNFLAYTYIFLFVGIICVVIGLIVT